MKRDEYCNRRRWRVKYYEVNFPERDILEDSPKMDEWRWETLENTDKT